MHLNENTKIIGNKVILIPYESKHVEKYHKWMQNPELQELTASEPLTLAEEYEMQRTWRTDEDKCTFLILCRETFEKTNGDEIASLIGDTNLFLQSDDDAEDVNVANDDNVNNAKRKSEAEIMIAEAQARGKGCGWEAMLLLLKYAQVSNLNIGKFVAKIGMENVKSLRMFKKMFFNEISLSDVFKEVTLECTINDNWIKWLDEQVGTLKCEIYER